MKKVCMLLSLLTFCSLSFAQPSDSVRQRLKGKVRSCKTISYNYSSDNNGKLAATRGLLEYGGDGYEVDSWFGYDTLGNIILEYGLPTDGSRGQKRVFKRDPDGRITESKLYNYRNQLLSYDVYAYRGDGKPREIKNYNSIDKPVGRKVYRYDKQGRQTGIVSYDADGRQTGVSDACTYDGKGNRVLKWVDPPVSYTAILNPSDQLIEERGVLQDGSEYYRNFHKYDSAGTRIQTIYTRDNDTIEVRNDPPSDDILDAGNILQSDSEGNWIVRVYPFDDSSGSMVIREILYY